MITLIGGFKVEALASEWLSLEIVRGLKRAQQEVPALAISDEDIHAAYEALETLFRSGALLEVPVSEVKTLTRTWRLLWASMPPMLCIWRPLFTLVRGGW